MSRTPSPAPRKAFEEEARDGHNDGDVTLQQTESPRRSLPTRTVAIIKTHAVDHRFEIEERIQQAGFEVIKERPMNFDVETDPEFMHELFGEDTASLAEGAVWVYVLERRKAVATLLNLMGERDPETARQVDPNSLRALYGESYTKNAVMGSVDKDTAELQIASLFASSPPFPVSDLPPVNDYGTMSSVSSSVLSALRDGADSASDAGGYAPSSGTAPSTPGNGHGNKHSLSFRARDIPNNTEPDIQPKTTRAARLRESLSTGSAVANAPTRRVATKESLARTFKNVPGHKRSETIAVASTAPPVVAPRMTRAASLRLGQAVPLTPAERRRSVSSSLDNPGFDGVPGHKRRESIAVASSRPPSIVPRLNKSAALRSATEAPPPSSWMLRTTSTPKLPGGLSRSNSQSSLSAPKPAPPPKSTAPVRSTSRASLQSTPSAFKARPAPSFRPPSVTAGRVPPATVGPASAASRPAAKAAPSSFKGPTNVARSGASTPNGEEAKLKPRPSSAASNAPSIAPRSNRSAMLRAAQMLEKSKAAVKTGANKTRVLMT